MSKTAPIFLLALLLSLGQGINAQPCGINPGIQIVDNGLSAVYKADTSSLLPGWISYQIDWTVNNDYYLAQDSLTTELKFGYNSVCVNVYATNPSTGDSCIGEHCNIFFSTGNAVYPFMDVTVNGTTVDFVVGYHNNGYGPGNEYHAFDFGDGNTFFTALPFATHTYASPGVYQVYLNATTSYLQGGNGSGIITQLVSVGGGNNLEAAYQPELMSCDSIRAAADANGPFSAAGVSTHLTRVTNFTLSGGSYSSLELKDIPGQDYLKMEVWDTGVSSDWENNLFVVQECGIVPDTAYGLVFNDLNANGVLDPMEPGLPGRAVSAEALNIPWIGAETTDEALYYATTDSSGAFKIPIPNDDMRLSVISGGGFVATGANTYNTSYDSSIVQYGPYHFGLADQNSEICGRAYMDDDQDSVYTVATDRAFANANIRLRNTANSMVYYAQTGADGTYCMNLVYGNYEITPVYYLLDSALIVPDTVTVNVPYAGTINNVDFGFTSPVQTNFGSTMTGDLNPRPGFSHTQWAAVYNTGALNSQGTVVMHYSPVFSSVTQMTPGGVHNAGNQTITWTTGSLAPGELHYYHAEFTIPSATPLGTVLTSYTEIIPLPGFNDNDLSNNTDTLNQTVVGSFDPNDKGSFPAGLDPGGIVMPDTRLTYRIRFQNTGTASAINVYVTDTLDQNLDINTFRMQQSSHTYSLRMEGRVVTWYFYNINLPDSGTNFALSNGFIEFSISPVPGLAEGTIVTNDAHIYFDFNEPVITNEAVNTFQTFFVGLPDLERKIHIQIFPQPAGDRCELVLHDLPPGQAKISIADLSGRLIQEFPAEIPGSRYVIPLQLQNLDAGCYLVTVSSGRHIVTEKLIRH